MIIYLFVHLFIYFLFFTLLLQKWSQMIACDLLGDLLTLSSLPLPVSLTWCLTPLHLLSFTLYLSTTFQNPPLSYLFSFPLTASNFQWLYVSFTHSFIFFFPLITPISFPHLQILPYSSLTTSSITPFLSSTFPNFLTRYLVLKTLTHSSPDFPSPNPSKLTLFFQLSLTCKASHINKYLYS